MTADGYVQKLLEISIQKVDSLRKILDLTEKQSKVILEDNVNELQRMIDMKQVQMNAIDELDQAFEVYYARMKSLLEVSSLEDVKMGEISGTAELKQVITTICDITKRIQNIEIENNKNVRDILDKLSSEIRQIKQGKIVNNGYNIGSKLPQQSYYFDKKK